MLYCMVCSPFWADPDCFLCTAKSVRNDHNVCLTLLLSFTLFRN
ncbi:hypothetical protein FB99_16960 [Pantoea agglomerans]|nr:hypothetical protein FB99_16960 [Pantoea agglomerans]